MLGSGAGVVRQWLDAKSENPVPICSHISANILSDEMAPTSRLDGDSGEKYSPPVNRVRKKMKAPQYAAI
jgi:hypothetical protein